MGPVKKVVPGTPSLRHKKGVSGTPSLRHKGWTGSSTPTKTCEYPEARTLKGPSLLLWAERFN